MKYVSKVIAAEGPPDGPLTIDKQQRALGIINQANQPGAMVFEYARGEEFQEILQQLRPIQAKDSPLSFFKDKDFVRSLGRVAAIDIFAGNYDRLAAANGYRELQSLQEPDPANRQREKEPAAAFKQTSRTHKGR
jgi:hypothetical protein